MTSATEPPRLPRGTGLARLFARLPLPLVHGIGAGLGALLAWVPNRHRRIAETNLALCLPELSAAERRRLARRSLIELGKTAAESLVLWLRDGRKVVALVREVSGHEAVEAALAAGQGAILAGPHLGAWELVGLWSSAHWPLTALYRPPRQAAMDALIHQSRERLGGTLVPTDGGGVRRLYQALVRHEVAGILPDQDPRESGGVFAPFFGVAANTMALLPRFAARSGAPVFVVWAERLPRGRGYHLHFEQVEAAINDPDTAASAAALNRGVERAIRQNPAQYQWSYKRFRTRPPGEAPIY